ncbi:hypothetical protein EXS73_02960 [Candidatus Pacearchaeota archaeon]|nr:hypothetical protein [Candidatus Pacearchaeota archaeon]
MGKRGEVSYFTPVYEVPSVPSLTRQLPLPLPEAECDAAITRSEYYTTLAELMTRKVTHNLGHFYGALFRALYRGRLCPPHKLSFETLQNGERRNFHPDFIQHRAGSTHYTEIKATSRRSSRPSFSVLQVENYVSHLLTRYLNDHEPDPSVRFALFRYGKGLKVQPSSLGYDELMQTLATHTTDVLLLPLPLTLLLLKAGNIHTHDQTSNKSNLNERDYWIPYASHMNVLNEGKPDACTTLLRSVKYAQYLESLEEMLCLDKPWTIRQTPIPSTLVCRAHTAEGTGTVDYPVTPFTVTEYIVDNQTWLRTLVKHRKELCKIMGLRDLQAEGGAPF